MDFLKDFFVPQPETTVIPAYQLKPGHKVQFLDGTEGTVETADFGDPHSLGFVSRENKVAAPFVIRFVEGVGMTTHPRVPVRIKQ